MEQLLPFLRHERNGKRDFTIFFKRYKGSLLVISEGQVILFRFPQTDQKQGKLRPALVLRKLPGNFSDYLICMISSQLHSLIPDMDEPINPEDSDFESSGLKQSSIVKVCRIAVVEETVLLGKIGEINEERLNKIKQKLASWITGR